MYITHTLCCTENHTCFFFFNDTATTEIYTLSLHDALPILPTSFHGAVPAPVIEGAVGLTKGLAGGLLAVDVLGSALILPTGIDNLTVDANATKFLDAALGIGYGLRVGVLNGAFPVPAVSVSWMHRTVPRLRYGTRSEERRVGKECRSRWSPY